MNRSLAELIAEIKLLISYLGEKNQYGWWECNFLGASSGAFLMHAFPRTTLLSQYHGVSEAALIIHDAHIGIGKNYHLFRLPVAIERSVAQALQYKANAYKPLSVTTAETRLKELAIPVQAEDGPMNIGSYNDAHLENLIRVSAGCYLSAFQHGKKCFPFMRGANGES